MYIQFSSITISFILIFLLGTIIFAVFVLYFITTASYKQRTDERFDGFIFKLEQDADETMQEVKNISLDLVKKYGMELREDTTLFKSNLNKLSKDFENSFNVEIQKHFDSLQKELSSNINEFKKMLDGQLLKANASLESNMKNQYEEASKEITSYKEKRLKEIDAKILTILKNISMTTFGKVLSMDEQKNYIMEILENQKKDLI